MQPTTSAETFDPINPESGSRADETPDAPVSSAPQLRPTPKPNWLILSPDQLEPDPDQPRKTFDADEVARLADSLKAQGQLVEILIQSIQGRDGQPDRYVIIDGERRWRTAKLAGVKRLNCLVKTGCDAGSILEAQLVANALRVDVAPVEQAVAFRKLMDTQKLTQEQLASKLGISQQDISAAMTLLRLPEEIRSGVDQGQIPVSAAVAIAKMDDPEAQKELAGRVAAGEMTGQEVSEEVRRRKPEPGHAKGHGKPGRKAKDRSDRGGKGPSKPITLTATSLKDTLRRVLAKHESGGIDPATIIDAVQEVVGEFREAHPSGDST